MQELSDEAMLSLRFKSVRKAGRETCLFSVQKAGYHPPESAPGKPSPSQRNQDPLSHSVSELSQEKGAVQSALRKSKKRRLSRADQGPLSVVQGLSKIHRSAERNLPPDDTKDESAQRGCGHLTEGKSEASRAARLLNQRSRATERRGLAIIDLNKNRKKRKRARLVKAPVGDEMKNLRKPETKLIGEEQGHESCENKKNEQKEEDKAIELLHNFTSRNLSTSSSQSLVERLHGGRFRALNEFLYTREGKEALAKFQNDPKLFDLYHAGYRSQVKNWPLNPLDCVVRWLEKQPDHWVHTINQPPFILKHARWWNGWEKMVTTHNLREVERWMAVNNVGDFGCGEAKLALHFSSRKIHSFDLVAANERITACDISNVPLKKASLDVAVFCLSLMGKDWPTFLREAHRVLKPKGHLVIAEVSSRVASLPQLISAIENLGFKNIKEKNLASFFFLLMFTKEKGPSKHHQTSELTRKLLKPCLYKRR